MLHIFFVEHLKLNMKKIALSTYLLLTYCLLGIVTWGSLNILSFLMLNLTFVIASLVFKKSAPGEHRRNGLYLGVPFVVMLLASCVINLDFSRGLPYLIFVPISIWLAYRYIATRIWYIPILSCLLFGLVSYVMAPTYFIFYHNRKAEVNQVLNEIDLIDSGGAAVRLQKDKIIVLDFWSTDCSICYEKFPALQQTFEKYKSNNDVAIYAVNVPIRRDRFSKTITILDSLGYSFPKLYATSARQIERNLHINAFPHLLIIKNGVIRYDGMLVTEKTTLLYNVESEIERLIKEP